MALMATESATSSKKHLSRDEPPDEHDTPRARSGEVDKTTGKKKSAGAADDRPDETVCSPEPANAEPDALDAADDLYDNVACTD